MSIRESDTDLQQQAIYYLEQWGNWRLARDGGKGYPTQAAFSRVTAPGVMSTSLIDDELGLRIDAIVSSLARIDPIYKTVALLSFHDKMPLDQMHMHNSKLTPMRARTLRQYVVGYVTGLLFGLG